MIRLDVTSYSAWEDHVVVVADEVGLDWSLTWLVLFYRDCPRVLPCLKVCYQVAVAVEEELKKMYWHGVVGGESENDNV